MAHTPRSWRLADRFRAVPAALVALALLASATVVSGQDLEPKAYSASPVGAAFLVLGWARSSGGVLTDPTLPLTDVNATVHAVPLAGGYTFGCFGKLAMVTGALPFGWADVSGRVFEEARTVTRTGLTDARLKFSVNLVGNPALRARAFAKAPRKTIVGTSLSVSAPAGQYDGTKLINLGTNRWAFKPEVGVSVPQGRWDFDAYAGVWLFAANHDFFTGGLTRTQSPVAALQGHVSYTIRPRMWVAFDATWYRGGSTRVEGGAPSTDMNNSRIGATLSLPAGRFQSFKVAYSDGVSVRTGSNFRTISVGWQFLRLTKM